MDLLRLHFIVPTAVGAFFAALTLFYFYFRTKEAYQLHLGLMFTSHLISLIFQGLNVSYPSEVLVYIYSSSQLLLAFFAINASLSFSRKKLHLKYHLHLIAGVVFLILSVAAGLKQLAVVSVLYGFSGASIIYAGLIFFKYSEKLFFEKLFSVSLILWGLHKFDYPFFLGSHTGQFLGYFLSGFLVILNVYALIGLLFEKSRIEILEKTELLNHVLENIPDIIVRLFEKNGIVEVVWVSPNVTRVLGYTIEETLKPGFPLNVSDRTIINDIRKKIIKEKKRSFSAVIPLRDAEGHIRYFEVKATKVQAERGQGSYYDAVLTEITKLKMLESDLSRIEEILLRTGMGIVVIDEKKTITYANQFMEAVLGVERDKLLRRKIDDFRERIGMLDLCSIYETCAARGFVNIDVDFGEEKKVFRCSVIPTHDSDGRFTGELMIFRDATELIKLEKIAERRLVIDEIRKNIGMVVHDFKNILASAIAGLSFLKEKHNDGGADSKILEDSLKNLHRLNSLVVELLEISSPITVKLKKNKITQIIESATSFLTPEERDRLHVLVEAGIDNVVTDERLLSRAVGNILRNAFDISHSGMNVKLTVRTAVLSSRNRLLLKPGKYLVFSISDRGPGISEEKMKNLFKPFFSEKKRSLGLGLYITYSFVSALSGGIDVQSVPGKGSTFSIHIPFIEEADINSER
jgi:PAS domain S-box-containing protein